MIKVTKISLIIAIALVVVVGGVAFLGKDKEEELNNFNLKYEASKEVDRVNYKIGDIELDLTPMHNDTKVNNEYSSNVVLNKEEVNFSLEVIDNGEVIYKLENTKIDLTNDKKAEIKIVDTKDGSVEAKIVNK